MRRENQKTHKERPNPDLIHIPPNSVELEKSIIGVCLIEPSGFERASDIIQIESFYHEPHQVIWTTLNELYRNGHKIDLVLVTDELRKKNVLDEIGGLYYLMECSNLIVSGAHLKDWCYAIQEKYFHRNLINLCRETISSSFEQEDIFEVLNMLEQNLVKLTQGKLSTSVTHSMELVMECERDIAEMIEKKRDLLGHTTGFTKLDSLTSGWRGGSLIIIAARPSVGKSAFSMNLALNAAEKDKIPVLLFSIEMPNKEVMFRMMSNISELNLNNIQRGRFFSQDEVQLFNLAKNKIASLPIFFDDTSALNLTQLKSIARRFVANCGVQLIVIDYLQIMGRTPGEKFALREQEVAFITGNLKALAKELNVPIIALSQLNRQIEGRTNRIPQLSDLRESGAIEQDADVVLFLTPSDEKTDVTVTVAKNRNGEVGSFTLKSDFSIQKFSDNEVDYQYPVNEQKQTKFGFNPPHIDEEPF